MESLRVLVCGGNNQVLQEMAQRLSDEGVEARTSTQVIDQLCSPGREWDVLLVDLSALNSMLKGLLPAVRQRFPNLSMVGIVNGTPPDITYLSYHLELDGYVFNPPGPEDLIVRLPHLAAKYRCDVNTFDVPGRETAPSYEKLAA